MTINDINIFSICKRIGRPLILDGAMGSLLQQRGFKADGPMWMSLLNIKNPEAVYKIHKEYISAGADIITTNTFRTNPAAVNSYPRLNVKTLVKKSVEIAREAAKGSPVIVAGSNAPAEDCYQAERAISKKELRKNHEVHIDLLIESGCHFILNETQSHFDEIKIICNHCDKNEIPYVLSLFFKEDLKLLSGEDLKEAFKFIVDKNPLAVGLNCIVPEVFRKAVKKISILLKESNWGFYLNLGDGSYSDDLIKCDINPGEYSELVSENLKNRPSFIGACCGSEQGHIKKLAEMLNEKK